jgi:hypothetical protein
VSGRHAAAPADEPVRPSHSTVESAQVPLLRVVSGDPTPDELAAVTALIAAVEARAATSAGARPTHPSGSAWTRSARAPRSTTAPGEGRWRGFSG